ncbi:hypothetical protein QJS82_10295 [Psychrobacter maritimus]|uniref:DUF4297 family anti-phage-associated protein n=1 Tax=Psychrobacter maritimus TaxID=256325 RepID=UPI00248B99F7|nr:DUF4297 family anti-phage-associated protein [Psychrobacter sp. WB2]WGV12559.1 hypothetical protein QJS82_10295 [Psychrobacter sp. WB2]
MSDRSAIHTIKGYFYQFDYTILQILNQQNLENRLTLEEIEDLDIEAADETTAVQCKYYEKTEYNHSVIAKPIRLMLKDFIERKRNNSKKVSYKVYGYYKSGQEKLILPINLDFLKSKFLTYEKNKIEHRYHEVLVATDDELVQFISILDVDINAYEYDHQLGLIREKLIEIFGCDSFEAENYYYNNALNEIKKLSVESNVSNRKVSKSEFLIKIDNKQIVFNKWFLKLKGRTEYFKKLRSQFFSSLNTEAFDRFFLIEVNIEKYSRADLIELILIISNKYSKVTRRMPEKFCPFIFISKIDEREILEVKKIMKSSGKRCIDGYEFQGDKFSTNLMLEPISSENPIYFKFLNNSEDLETMLEACSNIVHIYQFYLKEPFFHYNNSSIKHIKIELKEASDIKEII